MAASEHLNSNQFTPQVQTYRTVHPQGKNSVYTRLPGNRWMREKTATGETHVQDEARFVHPDYASGVNWANMEGGDHLLKGGVVNHVTVNNAVPKGHPDRLITSPVPDTHISKEPREGWTPVEWSHQRDEQGRKQLTSRHVGHPVAPLQRGDYK